MATDRNNSPVFDWWPVIAALGAVVLVRLGVLAHVPW